MGLQRRIRFNKDTHKKLMVWPGYLTKDEPRELKDLLEKIDGGFTARPRKGSLSEISKWIEVSSRTGIRASILFQEDGTLDFLLFNRASKKVPLESVEEICAWYMNAMAVLTENRLIE